MSNTDTGDPLLRRYRDLTNEARYERWRLASRPPFPDPDPYLCDHGVVGGFYINPATGRPGCAFCRRLPVLAWRDVHLSSPLPGELRRRAG